VAVPETLTIGIGLTKTVAITGVPLVHPLGSSTETEIVVFEVGVNVADDVVLDDGIGADQWNIGAGELLPNAPE
jgi:hypothetical protein